MIYKKTKKISLTFLGLSKLAPLIIPLFVCVISEQQSLITHKRLSIKTRDQQHYIGLALTQNYIQLNVSTIVA